MLAVEKSNTNNIPSNEGKSAKRFNFVVKTDSCIYAIECNFYSGGGSKLNETARSYKMIALESKDLNLFGLLME